MKKKMIAALMAGMMIAGCGTPEAPESGTTGGSTSGSRRSGNTVNVTEEAELINVSYSENDLKEEWIGSLSGSSMNLFSGVLEQEGEGQNICISPTSMMMAFGMLENGAGGETLSQMENVMNGGISAEQMNPIMYAMADHFESAEDVKWNVANSIWFRNDGKFEVIPEFAAAAKSWYDADILMAQFDDGTVKDVNSWVKKETRGMIEEIIHGFS
ncbi:MAG: hypothetical protein ILP17_05285, partial [Lachnospiraceae bacterium]|nr:hypothetical protein [Lachnospiraceae bacterium]